LYGQLNEARMFNGFVPVLVGILLCFLRDHYLQGDRASVGGLNAAKAECTARKTLA
jgi:hypothetical protein